MQPYAVLKQSKSTSLYKKIVKSRRRKGSGIEEILKKERKKERKK
jgi:hypothetical protein